MRRRASACISFGRARRLGRVCRRLTCVGRATRGNGHREADTLPAAAVGQLARSRHGEVAETSRQLTLHTLPAAVVGQLARSRHSDVAETSRQLTLHHQLDAEWAEHWWLTRGGTAAAGTVRLLVSCCQRVLEAAVADLPAGTPLATVAAAAARDVDCTLPAQPTGPSELGTSPCLVAFGASLTQPGRRELQVVVNCAAGHVAGLLRGVRRHGDPHTPGAVTWSATALTLALSQPAAELSCVPDRAASVAAASQASADRSAAADDADAARACAEAAQVNDAEVATAEAARRDAAAAEKDSGGSTPPTASPTWRCGHLLAAPHCRGRRSRGWTSILATASAGSGSAQRPTPGLTKSVFPQVHGRSVSTAVPAGRRRLQLQPLLCRAGSHAAAPGRMGSKRPPATRALSQ